MLRNIHLFIIIVFGALVFGASAQSTTKTKVAVYVTGDVDSSVKKILGAKLVTAITASGEFAAVERTADFLAALSRESDYQTSGEVRDSQIARLGQKFGVKFVVVADANEAFDEMFVASRLINVESGLVERAYDANGPAETMQQLIDIAEKVTAGLIGNGSRNSYNIGNVSSSRGGATETFTVNGVSFEMVRVDGGTFMMGSYTGDSDEQPVHSETVATFYIGKTEVTQALWGAVMGSNPSHFRGANLPVEQVSWNDCMEFCERLSRITGKNFRLPTEAEWEYAAIGGNKSRGYTYSGSNNLQSVGWYDGNSGDCTHPVGCKLDNELGLYDMSGNVWEWTSDLYSSNYDSYRNGGSSGSYRVLRGGSYNNNATNCRSAYRSYNSPTSRYDSLGFRLAL